MMCSSPGAGSGHDNVVWYNTVDMLHQDVNLGNLNLRYTVDMLHLDVNLGNLNLIGNLQ